MLFSCTLIVYKDPLDIILIFYKGEEILEVKLFESYNFKFEIPVPFMLILSIFFYKSILFL